MIGRATPAGPRPEHDLVEPLLLRGTRIAPRSRVRSPGGSYPGLLHRLRVGIGTADIADLERSRPLVHGRRELGNPWYFARREASGSFLDRRRGQQDHHRGDTAPSHSPSCRRNAWVVAPPPRFRRECRTRPTAGRPPRAIKAFEASRPSRLVLVAPDRHLHERRGRGGSPLFRNRPPTKRHCGLSPSSCPRTTLVFRKP